MFVDLSKIFNIRREYTLNKLRKYHLTKNPMHLFSKWFYEVCSQDNIYDPTVMCLATVDKSGQPFQRLVLLKFFNNEKMVFFTNFKSRKSVHLTTNPKVSVCFPWNFMDRQISITGNVKKLPKIEVLKYFYTRPKLSQISTWVSCQSKIISSRKILEKKFLKLKKDYAEKTVPLPNFWGGYTLNINSIEFWQGGINRLHDRFIYIKHKNRWIVNRLSP